MPQTTPHQAFTETVTTHYPPAWDTTTGPTVTRQFYGTVVPHGAVPWAVPVQQAQSVGADVAPIVARIRQGYREVGETFERTYPGYEIGLRTASIPIGAESRPVVVPEKANPAVGLLIALSVVLSLIVAFLAHDRLTSRRVERERAARRDRRKRRRDQDASAQTPPRA